MKLSKDQKRTVEDLAIALQESNMELRDGLLRYDRVNVTDKLREKYRKMKGGGHVK